MPRFLLPLLLALLLPLPAWAAVVIDAPLTDSAADTVVANDAGADFALIGGDNTIDKSIRPLLGLHPRGFRFNGVDDGVDITAAGMSLANSTNWTLEVGVRPFANPARNITGHSAGVYEVRSVNDTTWQVGTSAVNVQFTVPSIGIGRWHYLVVTRTSGNSMRLWDNGVESSSGPLTGNGVFAPTHLGIRSSVTTKFDGEMVGFRIQDTDESANVGQLYARFLALQANLLMQDNAATGVVLDSSPFAAHATLSGETTDNATTSGPGGSLAAGLILASGDFITLPDPVTALPLGSAGSVSFWFQRYGTTLEMAVGSDTGNNSLIRFDSGADANELTVLDSGGESVIAAFDLGFNTADGNWHHCVIATDGGENVIVYYDGAVVGEVGDMDAAGVSVEIIGNVSNNEHAVSGYTIFDKQLSAAEVVELYRKGRAAGTVFNGGVLR